MTADRAALVEKVGRALAFDAYEQANVRLDDPYTADAEYWNRQANIAIDLIRADVLEEAARCAEMMSGSVRRGNIADALYIPPTAKEAAAAIRALKGEP